MGAESASGEERGVSLAGAAAAIGAQFPELAGLEVRPFGEGTDNVAFLVGGRDVFRFPKRDDVARALAREVALLPWLAPRLPLGVPAYRFVGRPGEGVPRAFAGYAKLAGDVGLGRELPAAAAARVGGELGAFLRALHAAGEGAPRVGLDAHDESAPRVDLDAHDEGSLIEWRDGALADLEAAAAGLDGAAASWAAAFLASPPGAWRGPPRLLHGDLAAEHVLLDGALRPTGIIDWTDMARGDPALDFAGLVHWGGEAMARAARREYGGDDATLLARAAWFAACRAVADVVHGRDRGLPAYVAGGVRALRLVRDAVG